MQDIAVVAETVTVQSKQTINSSATLSLTSGAVLQGVPQIASGASLSIASGASLSLATGGTFSSPSVFIGAPGSSSSSIAVASGTSIPLTQGIVRVSATASTTSTTLTNGSADGQQVVVVNESANQVIVTGGIKNTPLTIAASSACAFVWLAQDTIWWHLT